MTIPSESDEQFTAEEIRFLQQSRKVMQVWLSGMKMDAIPAANAVVEYSKLILKDESNTLDERHRSYIEAINLNGNLLSAAWKDLLIMSEVFLGGYYPEEDVNLNQILEEIISTCWESWPMLDSPELDRPTIELEISDKLPIIRTDSLRVKHAITELLRVVISAAIAREINQIELSVNNDDVWIIIEITAKGIIYEYPTSSFDEMIFFARTLVELHGGKVELEDDSMITLTLPISPESV